MKAYTIKELKNEYISIPTKIIDRYLSSVSLTELKVLLFILGNSGVSFSVCDVANDLKIDVGDFEKAISFWISEGIFVKNGANLSLFTSINAESQISYDADTILYKKNNNKEFAQLLNTAEKILNKDVFYTNDASFILNLTENIGLLPSVVTVLLEYCVSINKKGYAYINKVAKTWEENGINSYKLATEYVENERQKNKKVHEIIGVYRNPKLNPITESETKMALKWTEEYGYDIDIISAAYDATVDTIGEFSPKYMSKIIDNWYKAGYKTIEDIKNEKAPVTKKTSITKKKNEKTSYDVSENKKISWNIVHSFED